MGQKYISKNEFLTLCEKYYGVNFRIQSEYMKIRTRKNSVFGHFSRSVRHKKRVNIYNVDIKKIVLLFNEKSYNKILIVYDNYCYGVIPLYIRLPIRNTIAKYSENRKIWFF